MCHFEVVICLQAWKISKANVRWCQFLKMRFSSVQCCRGFQSQFVAFSNISITQCRTFVGHGTSGAEKGKINENVRCTSFRVKFQLHVPVLRYNCWTNCIKDTEFSFGALTALRKCLLVLRMNFGLTISGMTSLFFRQMQFSTLPEVCFVMKRTSQGWFEDGLVLLVASWSSTRCQPS